ncbi:hypothetical protein EGH73_10215 [Epilithonimonas hominis]|uniref:Uncharacterized protein n=1 Tax=Epilithonimonas hominis TaxID=420404 RepID=A0A3N0X6Z3_9FLAO|nr:hypothetical protein EGH73_10215 [Epilithonimonas hominis]HAP96650.1 hypothetical protein [Chryseobacterium sp.]
MLLLFFDFINYWGAYFRLPFPLFFLVLKAKKKRAPLKPGRASPFLTILHKKENSKNKKFS